MNIRLANRRKAAVEKLLRDVRLNRPDQRELLWYLNSHCSEAWQLGFEAAQRDAKKKRKEENSK